MLMLKTKPRLVIVGGPNGSGKTTFATEFLSHENFIYLSADAIAYELDAKTLRLKPYRQAGFSPNAL